MKSAIHTSALVLALAFVLLAGCKKEKKDPQPKPAQESGQASTDNRDVQSEQDVVFNDINTVIMDDVRLRGRSSSGQSAKGETAVCGLDVDTTGAGSGSLTLNFNGTTCNNRTRTGTIKISIVDYPGGKRWKQAGCSLRVEFVDYKITRASDQKSIRLNGVQYFVNESGGGWWEFLTKAQSSLVSSVSGVNIKATFSDNKTATYNINRRVTYTLPGDVLTCTAEGTGNSGGLPKLENFGTTREGEAFTSQVKTPIVWNWTCGAFAPVSGDVDVQVAGKAFALRCTFGTDVNGNPVTVGANQCPYGWKLQWTVNGQNQARVIGYH